MLTSCGQSQHLRGNRKAWEEWDSPPCKGLSLSGVSRPPPSPFPPVFGFALLPLSPPLHLSGISFPQRWLRGQRAGVGAKGPGVGFWEIKSNSRGLLLRPPPHFFLKEAAGKGTGLHVLIPQHVRQLAWCLQGHLLPRRKGQLFCCPVYSNSGHAVKLTGLGGLWQSHLTVHSRPSSHPRIVEKE